jgi:bifunctional UDP-N-acetylglucosamine pyrophosphorylase/glucosamine-1-phosphate N-acetyltransferase
VSLLDPARFDLRGELEVGQDITIDVNVIVEGKVKIGSNVTIGANCILIDSIIEDNATIHANSILEQATVGQYCSVGPYARLRPGSVLKEKARVGNFVEMKKTVLGKGSKANHLTYLGDTVVGEGANIGAGTITCNYDGVNKFKTIIGDGAFIGSNSALVAPAIIGVNATVGAGSVVTKEVSANELAIARAKQRNMSNWQRPGKK